MDQRIIKPRSGLQLRKIKDKYMIVEVSRECVNMSDVYSLNRTAAELWEKASDGSFTAAELAAWLADKYGEDPASVLPDVERQIAEWDSFGLIEHC